MIPKIPKGPIVIPKIGRTKMLTIRPIELPLTPAFVPPNFFVPIIGIT